MENKNELTVINEQEVLGKQFKIYGTFEDPLFLAKDVAEWIDYSFANKEKGTRKVSQMLATVDEDEKVLGVYNVVTQGKHGGLRENQERWFLTEDGLYEVLMQSRKPIAKQFKKEVKRILKGLRKGELTLNKNPTHTEDNTIIPSYQIEDSILRARVWADEMEQQKAKGLLEGTSEGKRKICQEGYITIDNIMAEIKNTYPEEWERANHRKFDEAVWSQFLKLKGYLCTKKFNKSSGYGKEVKHSYQPTQKFNMLVDKGYAIVTLITDGRGKYAIKYTNSILELIHTENFRQSFFMWLGSVPFEGIRYDLFTEEYIGIQPVKVTYL